MTEDKNKQNKSGGGMYRGVNVPVKLLDFVIVLGLAAIVLVTVFASLN